MAESESYQSMTVFLSGFFPFSEELLHPGTSLEQDSKVQDVGLPVKPPSLSAFLAIAGHLATDILSIVLRLYGICRGWETGQAGANAGIQPSADAAGGAGAGTSPVWSGAPPRAAGRAQRSLRRRLKEQKG